MKFTDVTASTIRWELKAVKQGAETPYTLSATSTKENYRLLVAKLRFVMGDHYGGGPVRCEWAGTPYVWVIRRASAKVSICLLYGEQEAESDLVIGCQAKTLIKHMSRACL